jgi:hypothetical protein
VAGVRQGVALIGRGPDQVHWDVHEKAPAVDCGLSEHPFPTSDAGGAIGMVELIACPERWHGQDPRSLQHQHPEEADG